MKALMMPRVIMMKALCANGSGVDGDNCDIDRDGSKNGDGLALK